MAKYTELLSEYIEHGGELPAVFSQIEGFENLFIGRYCDSEIGFETPILFSIKLETKANIVIPAYAKRIAEFTEAEAKLINPEKIHIKTGNISREYGERNTTDTNTKAGEIKRGGTDTRTITKAEQVHNEFDLPFAGANTTDALTRKTVEAGFEDKDVLEKNDNESYSNYEDKNVTKEEKRTDTERYNDVKEVESGYSASEAGALFKALESEIYLIMEACLKEFENLFMKVY